MVGTIDPLVAIARRPEGPVPVRVERTADVDWAGDPVAASALVTGSLPLRVVEGQENAVPADVRQAWRSLAAARITPASVAALLRVLVCTTLDEPAPSGIARFDGAEPPPPFRPTAAHPRAYEGTGARPPKPPAARRFDLQAVAMDPRASRALVDQFPGEVAAARALLAESDRERAGRALDDEPEGAAGWDGAGLPRLFRLLVWSQLRWVPGRHGARVLGALQRHGRAPSPSLTTAVGWWLAQGPPATALPWLAAALSLPPDQAEVVLLVCGEAAARDVPPHDVPLEEVAAATGDDRQGLALELWTLLDAHRRGVPPALMLPGLELARDAGRRRSLAGERPAELVPAEPLRALGKAHAGSRWGRMAVDIWRVTSRCPGLAGAVLAQPWNAIDRVAADELMDAIVWEWPEADPASCGLGDWWIESLPGIVALARDRPPTYAAKVVDALAEAVSLFGNPRRLRALWPWIVSVTGRLAAPPFRPDVRSFRVWNNLVDHPPADLKQAVIEAPDRPWIELERRSRVPAQAQLLSCGLDALGRASGARLAESFLAGTPLLYEVAGLVGAMSDRSADRVCAAAGDGADAVAWLGRVRDLALADLGRGLRADVSQPRVRHALVMQRSVADNRRALRKFLRAHLDGDVEYVGRHPLTRRWLAAHPSVDGACWTSGIRLEATVAGIGPLTLRVETDPLEALRLGTYVGSCLSVRGLCDYSAVAVALDINKQVVYARNRRGSVIARQLLALSEDDALVVFAVYPRSTPEAVKRLFARYDRAFAAELRLPVRTGDRGEDDYAIAEVISSKWWDDGAWLSGFSAATPAPPPGQPA